MICPSSVSTASNLYSKVYNINPALCNKNSGVKALCPVFLFFENFSLQEDPGTWNYMQSKNMHAGLFT